MTPGETALKVTRVDQRYKTLRTLIRAAVVCFGLYEFQNIIGEISGKTTDLAIAIFADFRLSVAFTLAGCAAVWAIAERILRYRKTEYLAGRVRDLELQIDKNRSTSGLTPTGRTHPADREQ